MMDPDVGRPCPRANDLLVSVTSTEAYKYTYLLSNSFEHLFESTYDLTQSNSGLTYLGFGTGVQSDFPPWESYQSDGYELLKMEAGIPTPASSPGISSRTNRLPVVWLVRR